MRFEIAWVLARHAMALLATDELRHRFVASRPPFLPAFVLHALLSVPGQGTPLSGELRRPSGAVTPAAPSSSGGDDDRRV
jgi:3-dehydroquinate synthase class II